MMTNNEILNGFLKARLLNEETMHDLSVRALPQIQTEIDKTIRLIQAQQKKTGEEIFFNLKSMGFEQQTGSRLTYEGQHHEDRRLAKRDTAFVMPIRVLTPGQKSSLARAPISNALIDSFKTAVGGTITYGVGAAVVNELTNFTLATGIGAMVGVGAAVWTLKNGVDLAGDVLQITRAQGLEKIGLAISPPENETVTGNQMKAALQQAYILVY